MLMTPRSHGHTQGREGRFLEEPCMCSKRLGARIQLEQGRTWRWRVVYRFAAVCAEIRAEIPSRPFPATVGQRAGVERAPAPAAFGVIRVGSAGTPLEPLVAERSRHN